MTVFFSRIVETTEADSSQIDLLMEKARQGDMYAQNDLGNKYLEGKEIQKNEALAIEWYKKSAEQGFSRAYYNLGACYYNGTGVPKDLLEAEKWFQKSADGGFSEAETALKKIRWHKSTFTNQDLTNKNTESGDAPVKVSKKTILFTTIVLLTIFLFSAMQLWNAHTQARMSIILVFLSSCAIIITLGRILSKFQFYKDLFIIPIPSVLPNPFYFIWMALLPGLLLMTFLYINMNHALATWCMTIGSIVFSVFGIQASLQAKFFWSGILESTAVPSSLWIISILIIVWASLLKRVLPENSQQIYWQNTSLYRLFHSHRTNTLSKLHPVLSWKVPTVFIDSIFWIVAFLIFSCIALSILRMFSAMH